MSTNRGNLTVKTYTKADINFKLQTIAGFPTNKQKDEAIIESSKEQLKDLEPQLETLMIEKSNPTKQKIEVLQAQINVIILPAEIKNLSEKIKEQDEKLNELEPLLDIEIGKLKPLDAKIKTLKALITIEKCNKAIKELENEIQNDRRQRDLKQQELNSLIAPRNNLVSQIQELEHQLHHHPHSHHIHHQLAHLRSNRDILNEDINNALKLISNYDDAINHHHTLVQNNRGTVRSLQQEITTSIIYNSVANLEDELDNVENKRRPHVEEKNRLTQEIDIHREQNNNFLAEKQKLNKILKESQELVQYLAPNNNLQDLYSQIKKEKEAEDKITTQADELETQIYTHYETIDEQEKDIAFLTKQLNELNSDQFLHDITYNPKKLLDNLETNIRTALTAYEKQHPAHQPLETRICLEEFEEKCKTITNHDMSTLYPPMTPQESCKQRYYQLCGFVWKKFDLVAKENRIFARQLENAFGGKTLDPEEALGAYDNLKSNNFELTDLTEHELLKREKARYTLAYETLTNSLKQLSYFIKETKLEGRKELKEFLSKGQKVLKSINDRKELAVAAGDTTFAFKFHALLLEKTDEFLREPANPTLAREYKELATHIEEGRPSGCKKISGFMLMFVGAAVFVASAIAAGLSFGFSSPVSIAGMVAGAGIAGSGFGIFCDGLTKGPLKAVQQFHQAGVKYGMVSPTWNKDERQPLLNRTAQDEETNFPAPSAPPMFA